MLLRDTSGDTGCRLPPKSLGWKASYTAASHEFPYTNTSFKFSLKIRPTYRTLEKNSPTYPHIPLRAPRFRAPGCQLVVAGRVSGLGP